MSDTPETDALEIGMDKRDFEPKDKLMPYADLCRKLERERDQARRDELDESKWAKQYFEERNDARAAAKFWQEQYGHANPEHKWEEFVWERGENR